MGPEYNMIGVLIHRGRDTRGAHVPRKAHVRTQWEGVCPQAEERGLQRKQTGQHLDISFQNCGETHFCLRHQVYFDMAAIAN